MSLKIGAALAGIALLSLAGIGVGVTPAGARVRCGQAPTCDKDEMSYREYHYCKSQRAAANADCEARGVGYDSQSGRHRKPGKYRKYRKCKNTEKRERKKAGFGFDDATSMADCR